MLDPSLENWRKLYEAADRFKEVAPWEWMWDSDLFGVKHPSTGEIGYCCVLGKMGQFYGFTVYWGTGGLETWKAIQAGDIPFGSSKAFMVNGLLVAFENREMLLKQELEVIKKLGLTFRGAHTWPMFRKLTPGYHPWHLTNDDVKILPVILEQGRKFALKIKENPDFLTSPEGKEDYYPVRVKRKSTWITQWLEPAPKEEGSLWKRIEIGKERLRRIAEAPRLQRAVWEMDFFYSPIPVQEKEGERPYYPFILLITDHRKYSVLWTTMHSKISNILSQFFKFIENEGSPTKILVERRNLLKVLEPLTDIGITLEKTEELENVEKARRIIDGLSLASPTPPFQPPKKVEERGRMSYLKDFTRKLMAFIREGKIAEAPPPLEPLPKEVRKELPKIKGVGKKIAFSLYRRGFKSVKDIANADERELMRVTGIGEKTAGTIKKEAKKLLEKEEGKASSL